MIRGATFSSPDATISANTLQNTPHCDHSAFRPASSVGRWDLSGGDSKTTTAGPPQTPPILVVGRFGEHTAQTPAQAKIPCRLLPCKKKKDRLDHYIAHQLYSSVSLR